MKVLIVDDERLARDELRRLLKEQTDIQIVGEAANIVEAKLAIESLQPDLIFLDIRMPGGSGFDLLSSLHDAPVVIFTTAFDEYAIKAFQVNALDYLLKPIEPNRLEAALLRLHRQKQSDVAQNRPQNSDGKVFIKDGENCWFVTMDQIALFESEGNYTRVYFDQQRPLLLRSLNQLEMKLDPSRFFRVSRQHIVNLAFVNDVAPSAAGGLIMSLKNGLTVEMSRRRAAEFKEMNSL